MTLKDINCGDTVKVTKLVGTGDKKKNHGYGNNSGCRNIC
jgi:hypothetical protein